MGFKFNLYFYVSSVEFFVSILNVEGFFNVIVEVMCLGKVVVVINCELGFVEIFVEKYFYYVFGVSEEKNGILCEFNNV